MIEKITKNKKIFTGFIAFIVAFSTCLILLMFSNDPVNPIDPPISTGGEQ